MDFGLMYHEHCLKHMPWYSLHTHAWKMRFAFLVNM